MYKILTIAGSDCSGGAGIQADIKTITAYGMYAMSAITALTAQNTTGVYDVLNVDSGFLKKELDCIFTDIFPDAVKIGMVSEKSLINVIAEGLDEYKALNVVVDPVMISTSGRKLLDDDAVDVLKNKLFYRARLITPNIDEAEMLTGITIENEEHMKMCALNMFEKYKCAVLIKGGHLKGRAVDVLCDKGEIYKFQEERIKSDNNHGTGCTLSSAIACGLGEGKSIEESVKSAKEYLTGALKDGLNIGRGNGPLNHCYRIGKA